MAAAAQRGPDPRVSVMATALRRGTASVRYDAVRSIALLKEKALLNRYIPLLQERLDDRHPLVRAETVKTLARLKLPITTQVLIRALKHNSVSVRYLATQALGKEGVAAALKPLEKVLLDKSPAVRREAMNAIRRILQKIDKQRSGLVAG